MVLFLSTAFLTSNDCFAVKINGQEYTDEFTFDSKNGSNISFKLSNNNIEMVVLNIENSKLQNVVSRYETLESSVKKKGKKIIQAKGGKCWRYLTGSEKINFDSKPGFKIDRCILESPSIEHKGNRQQFSEYYAKTTNPVVIRPYKNKVSSIIKELTYYPRLSTTLPNKLSLPNTLYIQGDIDFKANETKDMFIVIGADKVKVKL